MTISSVNIAMGASYGAYNQKLTQATKEKLEELGISYNSNITEEEAKALIKSAQVEQSSKSNTESSNNQSSSSQSQSDLMKQAVELAQKLGIETDENTGFESLLAQIEQTLEGLIIQNENNISALQVLKSYSQKLANIQAQSTGSAGYNNTNQALMTSLEMLSEYNKNFLFNN